MDDQILDFILAQQTPKGAFPAESGGEADILTTARMVNLLFETNLESKYKATIQKSLLYLYNTQDEEGKWGQGFDVWTSGVTAWVLYAFLRSGLEITSKTVERGLLWLLKKQKPNGSFAQSDNIFQPSTYCTAYALRVMKLLNNSYEEQKIKALDWLAHTQNRDGGFGLYEKRDSNPEYTGFVLHALIEYENYFKSNVGQKAVRYLIDQQLENGSWPKRDLQQSIGNTAFALYILQRSGIKGLVIQKGFSYLDQEVNLARWDQFPLGRLLNLVLAYGRK